MQVVRIRDGTIAGMLAAAVELPDDRTGVVGASSGTTTKGPSRSGSAGDRSEDEEEEERRRRRWGGGAGWRSGRRRWRSSGRRRRGDGGVLRRRWRRAVNVVPDAVLVPHALPDAPGLERIIVASVRRRRRRATGAASEDGVEDDEDAPSRDGPPRGPPHSRWRRSPRPTPPKPRVAPLARLPRAPPSPTSSASPGDRFDPSRAPTCPISPGPPPPRPDGKVHGRRRDRRRGTGGTTSTSSRPEAGRAAVGTARKRPEARSDENGVALGPARRVALAPLAKRPPRRVTSEAPAPAPLDDETRRRVRARRARARRFRARRSRRCVSRRRSRRVARAGLDRDRAASVGLAAVCSHARHAASAGDAGALHVVQVRPCSSRSRRPPRRIRTEGASRFKPPTPPSRLVLAAGCPALPGRRASGRAAVHCRSPPRRGRVRSAASGAPRTAHPRWRRVVRVRAICSRRRRGARRRCLSAAGPSAGAGVVRARPRLCFAEARAASGASARGRADAHRPCISRSAHGR